MSSKPKITFGMIVLNGEPFVAYNLRALYPFAHQIIIVEGAVPAAKNICQPDGHSLDNTLEVLRLFKSNEDPEDKIVVITAEDVGYPDGFWPGEKDEQSSAYATRASGNYLWQVDVDEFYHPDDMRAVIEMLENDPTITAVSFDQITFWGGFEYTCDGWYLRSGASTYHRLFKWGKGYRYVAHRPPTVVDDRGRDLRKVKWIDGKGTARLGIQLYHYSLVFPSQVLNKSNYYGAAKWADRERAEAWEKEVFRNLKRPYRVHNIYTEPSWLEPFKGKHPDIIESLLADIDDGNLKIEIRDTNDVEALLAALYYRLGRGALKALFPLVRATRLILGLLRSNAKLLGGEAILRLWRRWKTARSYSGASIVKILAWLISSRETTNFSYDLTDANRNELSKFVANVAGITAEKADGYMRELETDMELKNHIRQVTKKSSKRKVSDDQARYGRRLGWYACVRALKPKIVVETGVEKGLGACLLAAALRRNADEGLPGRYIGTDIDPEAGFLLAHPYDDVGTVMIGDSVSILTDLKDSIDFVICDSDHDPTYETREYEALAANLSEHAVILSDNAHVTDALEKMARQTDRKFLFFREHPKNHWYPGAGIGAAFR